MNDEYKKPVNMSIRNFIFRRMSTDMVIPESVIETVVLHQFAGVVQATSAHNSVEISGFGKLMFNRKKAFYRMKNYESTKRMYEEILLSQDTPQAKRRITEIKMGTLLELMEALKPMLHED